MQQNEDDDQIKGRINTIFIEHYFIKKQMFQGRFLIE